jgi:Na+/proline symporter
VGIALGNHLSTGAAVGIAVALPAIALVSWQPSSGRGSRSGALYGLLAGCGFALLFIAVDRAGTKSGAWPLLPGQTVALLVVCPGAIRGLRRGARFATLDRRRGHLAVPRVHRAARPRHPLRTLVAPPGDRVARRRRVGRSRVGGLTADGYD